MEELPEEEKPGIPPWVVTFADLMSLLMCFFVLLLSFSEIDASKFKQIASELSKAFGVQREVPALEIPMGTSPVFDRFSPGQPDRTVVDEIRQQTTIRDPVLDTNTSQAEATKLQVAAAVQAEMNARLEAVRAVVENEIEQGRIDLKLDQRRIIISLSEKGSFASGSAEVTYDFETLLIRIGEVLGETPGRIAVEGHTDDIPIRGGPFASNWDLSAVRAAMVANTLLVSSGIDQSRLMVAGYAATRPRFSNDTAESRAKNRRVEIIIDLTDSLDAVEAEVRARLEGQADSAVNQGAASPPFSAEPPERTGRDAIEW